jgi:ribonuclease P protein component
MPTARLSFPRSARLNRAGEFARLKREGLSFHGKLIVLSVLKAETDTESRIGFITSRRVGGAVIRNRVRRRLREVVRAVRPELQRGWWIVLIAKQKASLASFEALAAEWLQLAQRSAILSPRCS